MSTQYSFLSYILTTANARNAIFRIRCYGNVNKKDNFCFPGKFGQVYRLKIHANNGKKKKLTYTQRENERAKRNRQRAKEENKKLKAQNKFLWKRYRAIAEEFEREYAETNGEMDKEPLPTATIPPYIHPTPPTENIQGINVVYNPSTLAELDLGDLNGLLSDVFMDAILDDNIMPEHF